MGSNDKDTKVNIKLSQLQAAFNENLNERYFEEIIKSNFNINHEFDTNSSNNQNFKSITAIHLAFNQKRIKIFNLFLRYGADILTVENTSTVLHKAVEEGYEEGKNSMKNIVLPFIQSGLAVHVDCKIFTNPFNRHGISHFHAACIINHVKAVEFFLLTGTSVNQAIHSGSPVLPGYTYLHLSVRYYALETVELLLKHKANVNLREKTGMTPLQLLMHRKIKLCDLINNGKIVVNETVTKELEVNDRITCLLLESFSENDNASLFYPYAVCTLTDAVVAEKLLKPVVNLDCSLDLNLHWWPGYTMLHFAAHCNFNTLMLLINREASIEVKDAKGQTPFDLCLKRYSLDNIYSIISCHSIWKNITMSDRKTKLRDVILAMKDPNEFFILLNKIKMNINKLQVPNFSPLWPGSTLLHLAVYFSKHQHLALIQECLIRGAEVTIKDNRGWTPIQLAFRKYKIRTTNLLLQHQKNIENPTDEDNLSHLHIACAMKNKNLVEKLMVNADLEVAYKGRHFSALVKQGATPIHVAIASESSEITKMLLEHGANLYAVDNAGLTPIYRVLTAKNVKNLGQVLLSQPNLRNCTLNSIGLNYLHAASYIGHVDAVRTLLELGANINASVSQVVISRSCFFKFSGFTPLHFAIENDCWEVIQLLVRHGADILAKKADKMLFYEVLDTLHERNYYGLFISALNNNYAFQRRMTEDSGMTMLHVACFALDLNFAQHLLEVGLNVNEQIANGSTIWPCCTPLHVLAKRLQLYNDVSWLIVNVVEKIDKMLKLLLDNGSDVTIVDADQKTPVHLFLEVFEQYRDDDDAEEKDFERLSQLLFAHKYFNINPTTTEGISHFHIACLINEPTVVEEFLKNGIYVNKPIDRFSFNIFAGCTALHLSVRSNVIMFKDIQAQLETIDLLVKYGADIHARDSYENTPFHSAAECTVIMETIDGLKVFERLLRAGADIAAQNIRRQTPFESALRSRTVTLDEIDFFIKNGYRLNTFSPITEAGIIGQLFCCLRSPSDIEIVLKTPGVVQVDEMGRTAIHNIVSFASQADSIISFYSGTIEKLIQLGCDIDARDCFGKTALHKAVKFHNSDAVVGLLDSGADMNVADFDGKSAFACALESCELCDDSLYLMQQRKKIIIIFATHVMKLQKCRLSVSHFNNSVQIDASRLVGLELRIHRSFYNELMEAKRVKVGSTSFFLHDFMSETGAVAVYPSTPQMERAEINKFFESLDDRTFRDSKCLLKLQHKKAIKRWQLDVNAISALRFLLQFPLPELCCSAIFRFLSNSDLTCLIESAAIEDENDDMKMCVD